MGAAWTLCQVVNSCVCPGREATGTGVTLSSAGSPASQDPTGKSQVTSFARALVISKTGDFFQEPNWDSDRVQGDCGDQAVPVSSLAQDGARNFLDCLIVPRGWGLGSHCAEEGMCHPQIMRPKSPCGPKEGQWALPVHRED